MHRTQAKSRMTSMKSTVLHLGTQPLVDGNASVNAFISDFRQELTSLRRTPLRGLAQRLHRAVLDAAKEENKDVEFLFIGEDKRLETHLQQQLVDALIHVSAEMPSAMELKDRRNVSGLVNLFEVKSPYAWSPRRSLCSLR